MPDVFETPGNEVNVFVQMATEQRRLSCEYCNYSCHVNESDHFFKHLIKFHSNEPNFLVERLFSDKGSPYLPNSNGRSLVSNCGNILK